MPQTQEPTRVSLDALIADLNVVDTQQEQLRDQRVALVQQIAVIQVPVMLEVLDLLTNHPLVDALPALRVAQEGLNDNRKNLLNTLIAYADAVISEYNADILALTPPPPSAE